jgi:hypothetical protein
VSTLKAWNQFQLNQDLSLSMHGYFYLYHLRNHNSYFTDHNAAFTELSGGLGFDLHFRDEFTGQFRIVGTGLYGRPEWYLGDGSTIEDKGEMETLIDLANVSWHTQWGGRNLDITAGLQELMYGDGFLIMDGYTEERAVWTTPIESFPAIKASYELCENSTLDLFAAHIPERHFLSYEAFLGEGAAFNTGGSLTGINFHMEESCMGKTDFGIFVKDEKSSSDYQTIPSVGLPPVTVNGPDSDTIAISFRDEIEFGSFTLTGELVRQYGETRVVWDRVDPFGLGDTTRRAWGGHITGRLQLSEEGARPYIQGRYVYFGGDKRSTSRSEAFDPFFFGWEDWGQWWLGDMTSFMVPHTNARIIVLETGFTLTPMSSLRMMYFNTSLLEELHNTSNAAARPVNTKGWSHELNVIYDYAFTDHVFCGIMGGVAQPREAAENWWGDNETMMETIAWIGFEF